MPTSLAKDEYLHVIALVHGIRDIGAWQSTVGKALKADRVHVAQIRFSYYPAARFLFPIDLSRRPVNRVISQLRNLQAEFPKAKISVIAHSFGTYVTLKALRRDFNLHLWKLVLCGSVADDLTDWAEFKHRVGDGQRPTKDFVVNDCGTADVWPVLGAAFGWHYGMAGACGFSETHVVNRFHLNMEGGPGDHSLYFDERFARKYWRPYLIDDQPLIDGDGVQGEHLPRYVKWLYNPLISKLARAITLLVWLLLICGTIAVGWYVGTTIWSSLQDYLADSPTVSPSEPVSPSHLANVITDPDFPSIRDVVRPNSIPNQPTTLVIRNESSCAVKVMLFNCLKHFRREDSRPGLSAVPFIEFLVPAATNSDASFKSFSDFPVEFNYFGVYVINTSTGKSQKVGFNDFSTKQVWNLDIRGSTNDLKANWANGN